MKKQGILFDLDGTLWEVEDITYKTVNEIVKKHNLKEINRETVHSVFGLNRMECAKKYFPYLEIEKALELMEEASLLNIKNLKEQGGNLYSNIEDVIIELNNNYELFIVSNTGHKEYIEAFLTTSGLEKYFKDYIAASQLNISKAEAIEKVIKDYELEASIYVGDTIKDLEASELAKIPFIQAKYGFGEDLGTKYYINKLTELPNKIKEIF